MTPTPRCAICDRTFAWPEARVDPGEVRPGALPRAPEIHCPQCDATVAQWHLDLVSDHAGWVLSHGQAQVNRGVGLPTEPPHRLGVVPKQRLVEPSRTDEGVGVP